MFSNISQFLRPIIFLAGLLLCNATMASWTSSLNILGINRQPHDLWDTLTPTFQLHREYSQTQVQVQITWLLSHQEYLRGLARRAAPYLYFIHQEVQKRHIPGEIALLPMIESSYNPFAYSNAGAAGLWQIMPGTGSGFGLKQDWWYDGRRDIYNSTNAALNYLEYLHRYFNGDWLLAIAAYDSGEGNVQRAIRHNVKLGLRTDCWSLPLPSETRAYVPRLLALAAIISNPRRYNVHLPSIPNTPYFAKVETGSQIDLSHAAKLAEMDYADLIRLNPGYNRWATDPAGPHRLVLPIDRIARFKRALAKIPSGKLVSWTRYKVKPGDSLGGIAHHYKTSSALIREVNHLKNSLIRIRQQLLIPKSAHALSKRNLKLSKRFFKKKKHHAGPRRIDHHVKSGDTISKLSRRYHVKSAAIRFWNHLSSRKSLKVGDKIIVWAPTHRRHHRAHPIYYTIKSGDTLSEISLRFHVSIKKLKEWNKQAQRKYLHPKKKLIIHRRG